jgi:hypothetical protein
VLQGDPGVDEPAVLDRDVPRARTGVRGAGVAPVDIAGARGDVEGARPGERVRRVVQGQDAALGGRIVLRGDRVVEELRLRGAGPEVEAGAAPLEEHQEA